MVFKDLNPLKLALRLIGWAAIALKIEGNTHFNGCKCVCFQAISPLSALYTNGGAGFIASVL